MNILIADDHQLIAEGLLSYFRSNESTYQLYAAKNKSELIYHIKTFAIDLIIQDVQFGEVDARSIIQDIKELSPDVKILALSSFSDAVTVKSVLAIGANSYVSKSSPLDEVLNGVKETLKGKQYLSEDIREKIMSSFLGESQPVESIRLTRREREVLDAIQNEMSTKEISEKLHISEKTVEGYRSNLLSKFGVKNVAGLVKQAILKGFIQ